MYGIRTSTVSPILFCVSHGISMDFPTFFTIVTENVTFYALLCGTFDFFLIFSANPSELFWKFLFGYLSQIFVTNSFRNLFFQLFLL